MPDRNDLPPHRPNWDNVVDQVRGADSSRTPQKPTSVLRKRRWKPKEMRLSYSPWIVRGLIGLLALAAIGEIFILSQVKAPDSPQEASPLYGGPTMEIVPPPVILIDVEHPTPAIATLEPVPTETPPTEGLEPEELYRPFEEPPLG